MSAQTVFCGLFAGLGLLFLWEAIRCNETGWAAGLIAFVMTFGYFAYQGATPEHHAAIAAEEKARAEQDKRERTPHVIREADGCKVYAWKGGDRYHYFTRCPASTTVTTQNWQECSGSGKHRTCHDRTEEIEASE